MTDADATVLDILQEIHARLGEHGTTVRADLEAIKSKIDGWPDFHFLQAAAQQQHRDAGEARDRLRDVDIRLTEIHGSMASHSEIARLRSEIAASVERERELFLRISAIEYRLGLRNPLAKD